MLLAICSTAVAACFSVLGDNTVIFWTEPALASAAIQLAVLATSTAPSVPHVLLDFCCWTPTASPLTLALLHILSILHTISAFRVVSHAPHASTAKMTALHASEALSTTMSASINAQLTFTPHMPIRKTSRVRHAHRPASNASVKTSAFPASMDTIFIKAHVWLPVLPIITHKTAIFRVFTAFRPARLARTLLHVSAVQLAILTIQPALCNAILQHTSATTFRVHSAPHPVSPAMLQITVSLVNFLIFYTYTHA